MMNGREINCLVVMSTTESEYAAGHDASRQIAESLNFCIAITQLSQYWLTNLCTIVSQLAYIMTKEPPKVAFMRNLSSFRMFRFYSFYKSMKINKVLFYIKP